MIGAIFGGRVPLEQDRPTPAAATTATAAAAAAAALAKAKLYPLVLSHRSVLLWSK